MTFARITLLPHRSLIVAGLVTVATGLATAGPPCWTLLGALCCYTASQHEGGPNLTRTCQDEGGDSPCPDDVTGDGPYMFASYVTTGGQTGFVGVPSGNEMCYWIGRECVDGVCMDTGTHHFHVCDNQDLSGNPC